MIDFNYTLLIQFVNIVVLLVLLNFFLFKPVLRAIHKRESTLNALAEKVNSSDEEAKNAAKMYDDGTKDKRRPILEAKGGILSEAHAASTRIVEKARNELTEELVVVRSRIEADSRKAFDTLKMEVDRLSSEAAEKILKRSL
jgi:F-type H+-transporting ATPase subunit b